MKKLAAGDTIDPAILTSAESGIVQIPDPSRITHLQFRRFAGCPMCNLHLRSFIQRHDELLGLGIQEVAVFHSTRETILEHNTAPPFPIIPDPDKTLYRKFGVEKSVWSVLHPGAWLPALRGVLTFGVSGPKRGESPIGLPADFLIGKNGRIPACKYGVHAYDQWPVDELLSLAKSAQAAPQPQDNPAGR